MVSKSFATLNSLNRGAFVIFFQYFRSERFEDNFCDGTLLMKDVLEWIHPLPIVSDVELIQLIS